MIPIHFRPHSPHISINAIQSGGGKGADGHDSSRPVVSAGGVTAPIIILAVHILFLSDMRTYACKASAYQAIYLGIQVLNIVNGVLCRGASPMRMAFAVTALTQLVLVATKIGALVVSVCLGLKWSDCRNYFVHETFHCDKQNPKHRHPDVASASVVARTLLILVVHPTVAQHPDDGLTTQWTVLLTPTFALLSGIVVILSWQMTVRCI